VPRNSIDETQYDTDCGDKTTLWRHIDEKTENRLSILRSKAPRFPEDKGVDVIGPGGYDTDAGNKQSVQKNLLTTPIAYSNVRTKTSRFAREPRRYSGADTVYNTDSGHKKCLSTLVQDSPINYANMSSVVPRFAKPKVHRRRLGIPPPLTPLLYRML
jgi:hypothetical protein